MVKINEYLESFKKSNKKIPILNHKQYRIDDDSHPCCYNLIDLKNDINYKLCLKENKKDDDFYYAYEIIDQGDKKYIYYKPAYSHYAIINTKTKEEWSIPNKKICKSLCEELNKKSPKMSEKRFWYIMCYCDDTIEAENKDEAYEIFCKKHHFKEEDAEFISYSEVEND